MCWRTYWLREWDDFLACRACNNGWSLPLLHLWGSKGDLLGPLTSMFKGKRFWKMIIPHCFSFVDTFCLVKRPHLNLILLCCLDCHQSASRSDAFALKRPKLNTPESQNTKPFRLETRRRPRVPMARHHGWTTQEDWVTWTKMVFAFWLVGWLVGLFVCLFVCLFLQQAS